MQGRIKKIIQPILASTYHFYLRKKRWYSFDGLRICVNPSVFHPGLLWTTHYLLSYLKTFSFKGKKVLELGAGSGLISLWINRVGAVVLASDLNPAAIESIEESSAQNKLSVKTIFSDLFDDIPKQEFDFILINPPFYPQPASNDRELAFFCGPDFEYFKRLFQGLKQYIHEESIILMVLSDTCDLLKIEELASIKGARMDLKDTQKRWGEKQLIYQINYSNN